MDSQSLDGAGWKPVTVLLVEDEPLMRRFCIEVLEDAGFAVIAAGHAAEALRVLETRDDICILFSDLTMPGPSGLELARRVHARWPHIQVLLTSGRMYPDAAVLPHGDSFIAKPFDRDRVVTTIRMLAERLRQD